MGCLSTHEKQDIDLKTRYIGTLSDDIYLALIYAADVLLLLQLRRIYPTQSWKP